MVPDERTPERAACDVASMGHSAREEPLETSDILGETAEVPPGMACATVMTVRHVQLKGAGVSPA